MLERPGLGKRCGPCSARTATPEQAPGQVFIKKRQVTQPLQRVAARPSHQPGNTDQRSRAQYSPLITKKEPRTTPASFDFWRANLKRDASSSGTSMPSASLNPTARFSPSAMPYITLTARPDS